MTDSPPDPIEAAAEEVRAHLVALRGGAPFLSPGDARLLLRWLDTEGAEASRAVRQAMERAVDATMREGAVLRQAQCDLFAANIAPVLHRMGEALRLRSKQTKQKGWRSKRK